MSFPFFRKLKTTAKSIRLFSLEIIVLLVSFFLALTVFVLIARTIVSHHNYDFDTNAFNYLDAHINPGNTGIMEFFTFLGTHWFLIPANLILSAWFLFIEKKTWLSIKIPAIALSSVLLMAILKFTFERARPDNPVIMATGFSFPSGHALMSVTFYGLIIYISSEKFKTLLPKILTSLFFISLILIIGISRVYLRVHYASDVIAGYCVGFMWLIVSIAVINYLENRHHSLKKT
ncbi:MAG: phosphatase PAP2 family protein [Ginsengibacter sp.]